MNRYIANIWLVIIYLLVLGCSSQSSKIYYSPNDYPDNHKFIYNMNIVEDLYWEIEKSDGDTSKITKDHILLTNVPEDSRQAMIDAAILLHKNKQGK